MKKVFTFSAILILSILQGYSQKGYLVAVETPLISDHYLDSILITKEIEPSVQDLELDLITFFNGTWERRRIMINDSEATYINAIGIKKIFKRKFPKPYDFSYYQKHFVYHKDYSYSSADHLQFVIAKQNDKIITIYSLSNQLFYYLMHNKNPFNISKSIFKLVLKNY